MEIDYSNPGHIKLALLSDGFTFNQQALENIGSGYKEKIRSYDSSDRIYLATVPQEIALPDEVVVGVHWRPDSHWIVKGDGDNFVLYEEDRRVCDVKIYPRPRYYDIEIEPGVKASRIGVTLGKGAISFFLREDCEYWQNGDHCKFCSLKPTQMKFKETEQYKRPETIGKVVAWARKLEDELHHVQFSGGSRYEHDLEFKEYIEAVKVVSSALGGERVNGNLITMPPRRLEMIQEAFDAGMNHISFNIEVFDQKLFREICPGKERSYGLANMLRALEYAATIFEKGTYTTFVSGLEKLETVFEGWDYLAERGVIPAMSVFHPNPNSVFANKRAPSKEYLLEAVVRQHDVYKKFGFKALLCKSCNRNSLDNEAAEGYFK